MLDKTQRINELLDWYENMLTDNQRSIATMHFREDFSLAEIAENVGSSRSAVHETIRRVETVLEETESKLHCAEKFRQRKQLYQKLRNLSIDAVDEITKQLLESE